MNSTSFSGTPSDQSSDYKIARLEEQIKWQSRKARDNKKRFRMYEIIVIFAGAIVPIVNVIGLEPTTRVISSILGGLIAIVTEVTQLENIKEIGLCTGLLLNY